MDKPFAITLDVGTSLANKTGSWRVDRPVYLDRMPPCNDGCPAGENIQGWLYYVEEGDYEQAWRHLVEDNPMPAIMGRVCYHPCETACNRAKLDEAVGINAVERFLGDQAIEHGWSLGFVAPPSGKKVLIIGSGPAGLSAAYHLRRLGHAVTIYEAGWALGGMMRFGIPKYRLPRAVLDAEIERICALGVEVELGHRVEDVPEEMRVGGFDAVFIAVGAQLGKRAYLPAGDSAHVIDAVSLLHSMEGLEPPSLGRRVAIYGGGDTAMDAARTAKRLGATDAVVVYRRTREKMPAHDIEVEEAVEEGVLMKWLSTITDVDFDKGRIVIEKMALDETGFPQPTGEFEELDADCVVLALGQDSDLSLLASMPEVVVADGSVQVGPDLMTARPGVFAGGDVLPVDRTVTTAVGNGKKAARAIDAWLRGETVKTPPRHELAGFELLNTWYYADAPRTERARLEVARRTSTFDEIVQGLDETNALFEARRCMSCGNCFECDNCFGVCPDNAVVKLGFGSRYRFEYDYCKGCGMCVSECPCGAIVMEPELA
ncbi:MAG: NAD(P)-binding protein [Acidimicrobiales bacterium]|jgi:NADPH-dependent glutamate synthase beta subunit-like oxidoreductase